MKYQEAMIIWTPPSEPGGRQDRTAGKLKIVPFGPNGPRAGADDKAFMKSVGACDASVQRMTDQKEIIAKVMADFVHLVRDERLDPDRVHRAFMEIDEYRDIYLAEPLMGQARSDDSDPRVEWRHMEIAAAELPTWDEAVAQVQDRIETATAAGHKDAGALRDALLRAISADVRCGRQPRVEVQALRLAIEVAGMLHIDRTLEWAGSAAESLREIM